jgi:tRNA threonylcarbamoyladenosine biosynthesis protein TsaE
MLSLEISEIKDINIVAKILIEYLTKNHANVNCIAFYGKMGVGKTTFIKSICEQLQVIDEVTSPTFAIINEYNTVDSKTIYHFDFYRINKIEEVFDFGCEEYFYSQNLCFIEWPELIEDILPKNHINVIIEIIENEKRLITVE